LAADCGELQAVPVILVGIIINIPIVNRMESDFIIVMKKWPQKKSSLHSGDIDATVFDISEFQKNLEEHKFLIILCLWWAPIPLSYLNISGCHQLMFGRRR
jgi:hypothetical protein